jgi:hypothetical protein
MSEHTTIDALRISGVGYASYANAIVKSLLIAA